ncbi:MAG: aminopeptidase P N-terminal domain-containing protein [Acidobacteria bacterium]|jgi:Xaa-Pro aminopeptidase|nr:aminopeptidase P N-terminal domain-containing protein [Acidobacteriota bacterium]
MFSAETYTERRNRLKKDIGSGLVLFLGNDEVGRTYAASVYPFRQDSTFLYFWGVDQPGLAALIDIDADADILVGEDATIADVVWSGPLPTLAERGAKSGVTRVITPAALQEQLSAAVLAGRPVHYLAPYRSDHTVKLAGWLGLANSAVAPGRSEAFHTAIVAQRSYKSAEELAEMERAVGVSKAMYAAAMAAARPGKFEYEIVAEIERVAVASGGTFSFLPICSVHGETLHNPYYRNQLKAGDVMVLDSGAETANAYASDITRTLPIGGTFTSQQRLIYEIVLRAEMGAIAAVKPGVAYRDVHLGAARSITVDLMAAGLMKGDPDAAVAAGAHALFFPHGLGHMIGLDVHDMENLGEQYVGYGDGFTRSKQFGLAYLRLARTLEPGFTLTVEPGIYFVPALIDQWKADGTNAEFLNFAEIEKFRDARGYRVEDNVVVTDAGCRVLGPAIPKTVADVEAACAG